MLEIVLSNCVNNHRRAKNLLKNFGSSNPIDILFKYIANIQHFNTIYFSCFNIFWKFRRWIIKGVLGDEVVKDISPGF